MKLYAVPGLLFMAISLWNARAFAGEHIRMGAEDDWSPYSSSANAKPQGFAVDLVRKSVNMHASRRNGVNCCGQNRP